MAVAQAIDRVLAGRRTMMKPPVSAFPPVYLRHRFAQVVPVMAY